MNKEHEPEDDVLERSIRALLATAGPAQPPPAVMAQLREQVASRQKVGLDDRKPSLRPDGARSWPALAAILFLMITAGWTAAYHRQLLSDVAAQQVLADGRRYVFYTDGRVKEHSPANEPKQEEKL